MLHQLGCDGNEEFLRGPHGFQKYWENPREFGAYLQAVTHRGVLEGHPARLLSRGDAQVFLQFAFFDAQTGLVNGISAATASRRP